MAALLGAGHLVLDVDTRSALLDKHLGELHDGGQAAVTRVGVGNDRAQVVDVRRVLALLGRHARASLALLAVVEELGHEQVLDLVGHRVGRVVGQVGTGLVGRRRRRRRLPARDVDRVEVLCHLRHLDRVETGDGRNRERVGGADEDVSTRVAAKGSDSCSLDDIVRGGHGQHCAVHARVARARPERDEMLAPDFPALPRRRTQPPPHFRQPQARRERERRTRRRCARARRGWHGPRGACRASCPGRPTGTRAGECRASRRHPPESKCGSGP